MMGDFGQGKCESMEIRSEKERFSEASEGRVGFNDEEFGDERGEFMQSDIEEVQFIVKDESIKNTTRGSTKRPAMEGAKMSKGRVWGVKVN